MVSRRERFRQVLLSLDPIATTTTALSAGWVQPPPDSFLERMQVALELDLPRRYVLMGGVGSGKTTELLRLKKELESDPKRLVVYLDVSASAEPDSLQRGAILALVGVALCDQVPKDHPQAKQIQWMRQGFHDFAFGLMRYPDDNNEPWQRDPPDMTWIEGGVARPAARGAHRFGGIAGRLEIALGYLKRTQSALLVLIDGLDRLSELDLLEPLIRYDLQVLQQMEPLEVSSLLVAPLSLFLGAHQPLRGGFDQEFLHLYRDPAEPRHEQWLRDVLAARVDEEMLPLPVRHSIVRGSGGVLRDLLMIARSAVEEAYLNAADQVEEAHVERVLLAHGRRLLLGTGKEQLAALLDLHREGNFELITDEHVDLLLHRRVLFYDGNRYAVHPAIAPLLDRLSKDGHGA